MFGNWKGEIFSFVEQYVLSMGPRCKCSSTNPCMKMILECLVFLMSAYDGLDMYAEILQYMFKVEKVMHKIVSIASFKLYIANQFNYTRNGTFIWFTQRRLVIVDNYIFKWPTRK